MNADHIYVLDQGRVVEDGTHDELMARPGGLYEGMFTAQAAQYGITPAADMLPGPAASSRPATRRRADPPTRAPPVRPRSTRRTTPTSPNQARIARWHRCRSEHGCSGMMQVNPPSTGRWAARPIA